MMALIHGQVFDAQGAPLAEVPIFFIAAPVAMPDISILTDEQGQFTLAAPVAGRYTLGARSDDGQLAQAEVEIMGEEPVTVTIHFSA
jgi:hypothetical protein